jgi:hypothetical protein
MSDEEWMENGGWKGMGGDGRGWNGMGGDRRGWKDGEG